MTEPANPAPIPAVSNTPPPRGKAIAGGKQDSRLFAWVCWAATWSSVVILAVLLVSVFSRAWGWLDWQFLTSYDSMTPERAGIFAGLLGTTWLILLTGMFSIPTGVGAALYLEEYASNGWVTRLIRVNLANLAGVPSIVYGILGFTLFGQMLGVFGPRGTYTRWTGHEFQGFFYSESLHDYLVPIPFGPVILSGALTMSLLILPVIIIASQEALRAVPPSLRHASLALGATKWQTIRYQVLPAAIPGIMTGVILSMSRAIGETAPLIILGVASFVLFAPGGVEGISSAAENPEGLLKIPFDQFTAIPLQIYHWAVQSKPGFEHVAAAGIIVLLGILLILNGIAILIRNYSSRHSRW